LETNTFTTESVKELYQRHGAALTAYGCCCGLDFGAAEDVVQQVFLKLLQGPGRAVWVPQAYLYRAVRNASMNYLRDRRHEVEMPEKELWFNHATADRTEVLALQQALRDLPEQQREVVFLRIWSGMTLEEIAGATETSLNTVASRYRYALDKLRDGLREATGKARRGNAGR
jgi:RNA polymerase sigma-70 factor (ECF subfamily)